MEQPSYGAPELAPTGISALGAVPWGTHVCHFYRSGAELRDSLVPYFAAGLRNGEQCLWITSPPLDAAQARRALAEALGDAEQGVWDGQIQILDTAEWYRSNGQLDGDAIIRAWLEREEQARAKGYGGLRVAGNTAWLERDAWSSFAAYEAAVHTAFRGRRIVAMCSYSLNRCSMEDVLDVLRNHQLALMCRRGQWAVARSATELLSVVSPPASPPCSEHRVHLYSDGRYPADAVAEFLAKGIAEGGAATAIATAPHLRAIEGALRAREVPPDAVRMHDADKLLSSCVRGPAVTAADARTVLANLADELTAGGRRGFLYGEMVDLLCRRQDIQSAIELEQACNDVLSERAVTILCGYGLAAFRSDVGLQAYSAVCSAHAQVTIDAAAQDQHLMKDALANELQRSKELQAGRARLLRAELEVHERIARLQRITSGLSEAVTVEGVAGIIVRNVRVELGAVRALVVTPDEESGTLHAFGCDESADGTSRGASAEELEPLAGVLRTKDPLWLHGPEEIPNRWPRELAGVRAAVCVPLKVGARSLGAVALAFSEAQEFAPPQRAFIDDVARQAALALERAYLYEEARRSRQRAEDASTAKDEFLGMLGHELRNPLAAIRNAAELLTLSDADPRVRRAQAVLERQSSHMGRIIDGLLDVSRIVLGKIVLEEETVDLVHVLRGTIEDRLGDLAKHAIELRNDIPEGPLWVRGDRVRLAQVFDNLMSNAVKFTGSGGTITLAVRQDGGQAMIELRDTGVGIDGELLPHVFEPFRQAAQGIARSEGGLGLGLALARGLAELHGGTVTAASDGLGQGSVFTVSLPLAEGAGAPGPAFERAHAPVRVLVIEDNEDTAELLGELLEADGHEVTVTFGAEQALEAARRMTPQVVLCDIGLPGDMDGYDVARTLRADLGLVGAVLVAFTGYGRSEDVRRARDAGFDVHLTKPVDLAAVQEVLARVPRADGDAK